MSIPIQEAVLELTRILSACLLHRVVKLILNPDLANDLEGSFFPEIPEKFEDACTFFRVFFANISNPEVNFCGRPIIFPNIFMAIRKFKIRIRVFKRILSKTAKEYCHYEALFAVMCEVLHNPVSRNPQNERLFLLKCMIILRIEQRQQFHPGQGSELTHLCKESIDEIIKMIFNKHGMRDREETREAMKSRLRHSFNALYDGIYSEQIRLILQSDPKFFETWEPELKSFFSADVRSAKREKMWLNILKAKCKKFWEALSEKKIIDKTKSWILYWYFRHSRATSANPETFSELMRRLVQPDQMSFPFENPPKLFLNDDGHFKDLALRWGTVLSEDLLEICLHAHVNTSRF